MAYEESDGLYGSLLSDNDLSFNNTGQPLDSDTELGNIWRIQN